MGKHSNIALVSGDLFKSLMRNIASSVAVITTNQGDKHHGMTATAMCSVSADPATILIVVNRSTRSHPIISAAKSFTVNILAEHQHAISGRFASKHDDPFDGIEHRVGANGSPIIKDVAAYIECTTVSEIDVGTHTIFIGNVIGGDVSQAHPLVYHEGEYKSLSPRSTDRDVAAMFLDRWSPRAFAASEINDELLMSFFEAARWAPSSMNAQPWRFVYVKRGEPGWQPFLDALSNTNRSWASQASALIAFVSKKTMEYGGKEVASPTHSFDTGAAWMSFALQASLSGWHTHGMAGFNGEKLRETLAVPASFTINAVAAIGKLGDGASLPEHLKVREIPSERNSLAELVFNGTFGAE
ncbi:flavin reductase (DIM6/NTAB) family NADH-FMN oxidoreductase RutF/nitroreductase [Nitrobacteraceae bacterium AZCC 2161]